MDIKSKIFRRKSGKSSDKWVIRIEYFDESTGRTRFMERQVSKRGDAGDERDRLISELKKSNGQSQTGERMTFNDLADIAERVFYKPAVIIDGRKVAGVRSIAAVRTQIKTLRSFFGTRRVGSVTTESLTDYKLWRLRSESGKKGGQLKIATVNRELAVLRKLMRYAYSKGWMQQDIFFNAKVIEASGEVERGRTLTRDEESRLLAACSGERVIVYKRLWRGKEQTVTAKISNDNPHLKAMIILALDSGMRRGEIFKLRWEDIDFENNLIRIIGTHTKTERERLAPLSQRAKDEIRNLVSPVPSNGPFPFVDIKKSFETTKKIAGIADLRFHDLRRSAITRWIQNGTSLAFAGKFAGHSQLQTTMKHYTATDAQMVAEVSERVNAFNLKVDLKLVSETVN